MTLLRPLLAAASGLVLAALVGCSRPAEKSGEPGAPDHATAAPTAAATPVAAPKAPDERQRLIVFAASSLTDVFNDLERGFEAKNADVDVALSYGGSQVLKLQISEGAPSDVFASADEAHMKALVDAGLAQPSQVFAQNELVVVVPQDNPAKIHDLKDLKLARRLVIGAASVPVGAYTRELLARAGKSYGAAFEKEVLSHVVSEESNVRLVRTKVELGEADAAVVYRTDAVSSKQVVVVPIAPDLNVRASYPIALLTKAPQPELAKRWLAFVLSTEGRAALAAHGFLVEA